MLEPSVHHGIVESGGRWGHTRWALGMLNDGKARLLPTLHDGLPPERVAVDLLDGVRLAEFFHPHLDLLNGDAPTQVVNRTLPESKHEDGMVSQTHADDRRGVVAEGAVESHHERVAIF